MSAITKAEFRQAMKFETDAEIAGFFGITASAVSLWKEDSPIPELRQYQARQRWPDLFAEPQPDQAAPAARVA